MYKTAIIYVMFMISGLVAISQNTGEFNVLLITIDDLNDWTEPGGGHPQTLTPNLTRFAAEAITFTNGYSNSPICNPSRSSFLTGFLANSTGVFFNGPSRLVNETSQTMRDAPVLASAKTLPEYFSEHGYKAISMGKVFHDPNSDTENWDQWQRTFGDYGDPEREEGKMANGIEEGLIDANMDWGPTEVEKSETRDFITANWVSNRIQALMDTSFLVATGIYRPHLKWYVPGEFFEKFPLDEIIVPAINETDLDDIESPFPRGFSRNFPTIDSLDLKDEAVRAYLASVNYADEALGVILDGLEMSHHYDNTVVVIVGDHGWHLGEKLRYKKTSLWEEGTKTTFMIKIPGHPMTGQKIDVPVSLLDLYPTLVELCNLPPNSNLQGESVLSIIDEPQLHRNRAVYSTIGPKDQSIKTKRWRYTRYRTGTEELYDHENDSLEHRNLINDDGYSDILSTLKISLDSVLLKDRRQIQYPITHHYFPGEIQFEKYDSGGEGLAFHDTDSMNNGNDLRYVGEGYRFDGVDVFPTNDEGGGFHVRMQASEWLEYSVEPNSVDILQWSLRYRSQEGVDSELEISMDGIVYDTIHLRATDSTWITAEGAILSQAIEDSFVLRMTLLEGEVDLNYLETNRRHYPEIALVSPIEILENEVITNPLLQIIASDEDGDSLRYSILNSTPFDMDPHGHIRTNAVFDFEDQNSYMIEVLVSDGFLIDTTSVEFNIIDVNEPPTVSDMDLSIEENLAIGSILDTLTYSDPEGNNLVIQVVGEDNLISVNNAGVLTLAEIPDYELMDRHVSSVVVWDGTYYDTAIVNIDIINVNESPVFLSEDLVLAENQEVGAVDTLQASDPEGDQLFYSLNKSSPSFFLASSGELILLKALDFEKQNQYKLDVILNDGTLDQRIEYIVNVTDVNETPRTLLANNTQESVFLITEVLDSAAFKLEFSAHDPESDTLSYHITWDGGDWFARDNYLINQSLMDFSDTTFTIHVEASDGEFMLGRSIQINFMVEEILTIEGPEIVNLYPNPVNELLFVEGIKNYDYVISNLEGKEMTKGNQQKKWPIDVGFLPRGLYILKILYDNQSISFRFIKE